MAHSLSAKKRVRQNLKKRLRNKQIKSVVRSQTKQLHGFLAEYADTKTKTKTKTKKKSGESSKVTPKQLQQELQKSYQLLDKAVTSGIFHRNKSNRLKSRLSLAVNKIR